MPGRFRLSRRARLSRSPSSISESFQVASTGSWGSSSWYLQQRSVHPSAWRNCLENRDSLQFAAPSVGNGGREAPFRSPVPSNIPYRETRQLFSKQFQKGNSPKLSRQRYKGFITKNERF